MPEHEVGGSITCFGKTYCVDNIEFKLKPDPEEPGDAELYILAKTKEPPQWELLVDDLDIWGLESIRALDGQRVHIVNYGIEADDTIASGTGAISSSGLYSESAGPTESGGEEIWTLQRLQIDFTWLEGNRYQIVFVTRMLKDRSPEEADQPLTYADILADLRADLVVEGEQ